MRHVPAIRPLFLLFSSYLEHGAVLKDVLFIADHAVLVERGDPLLWVLHYLPVGKNSGVPTNHDQLISQLQYNFALSLLQGCPGITQQYSVIHFHKQTSSSWGLTCTRKPYSKVGMFLQCPPAWDEKNNSISCLVVICAGALAAGTATVWWVKWRQSIMGNGAPAMSW